MKKILRILVWNKLSSKKNTELISGPIPTSHIPKNIGTRTCSHNMPPHEHTNQNTPPRKHPSNTYAPSPFPLRQPGPLIKPRPNKKPPLRSRKPVPNKRTPSKPLFKDVPKATARTQTHPKSLKNGPLLGRGGPRNGGGGGVYCIKDGRWATEMRVMPRRWHSERHRAGRGPLESKLLSKQLKFYNLKNYGIHCACVIIHCFIQLVAVFYSFMWSLSV